MLIACHFFNSTFCSCTSSLLTRRTLALRRERPSAVSGSFCFPFHCGAAVVAMTAGSALLTTEMNCHTTPSASRSGKAERSWLGERVRHMPIATFAWSCSSKLDCGDATRPGCGGLNSPSPSAAPLCSDGDVWYDTLSSATPPSSSLVQRSGSGAWPLLTDCRRAIRFDPGCNPEDSNGSMVARQSSSASA
jgi:hypothetical protein